MEEEGEEEEEEEEEAEDRVFLRGLESSLSVISLHNNFRKFY